MQRSIMVDDNYLLVKPFHGNGIKYSFYFQLRIVSITDFFPCSLFSSFAGPSHLYHAPYHKEFFLAYTEIINFV